MSVRFNSFSITEKGDHFIRFRWILDISLENPKYYDYDPCCVREPKAFSEDDTAVTCDSTRFQIPPYDTIPWQLTNRLTFNRHTRLEDKIKYFDKINFVVMLKIQNFESCDLKSTFSYNILHNNCIVHMSPVLNGCYLDSISVRTQDHLMASFKFDEDLGTTKEIEIEGQIMVENTYLTDFEKSNVSHLQHDLKCTFEDPKHADVHFEVGADTLHAHKLILISRSPVFQSTFEHDMKESLTNTIKITDVEKHIMEAFLLYLYTGKLEDHTYDTVAALFYVADKYQVKSLLDTCSGVLSSHLSIETVLNILKLSDMHHDDHLKTIATKFILDHFQEIYPSSEWKSFVGANPSLSAHALHYISSKVATGLKH